MSKTKQELLALKEEVAELDKKLETLTDDELKEVTGGVLPFLAATTNMLSNVIITSLDRINNPDTESSDK